MNPTPITPDENARLQALFDAKGYLESYPEVAKAGWDPLQHYLEFGAWEMRNPHPLFDSDWYLRTYPEVAGEGINPLRHYLTTGGANRLDPNPLFDSRTYMAGQGSPPDGVTPLEDYLKRGLGPTAGVYPNLDALLEIQKAFLDRVEIKIIADHRDNTSPWAVFLQCGRSSLHHNWLTNEAKPWHLIVNFYDESHSLGIDADLVLSQNLGTKFTAIYRIIEDLPDLLAPYDYVLFLDDDILATEKDITRLFSIAAAHELLLVQPSVLPDSEDTWEVLRTRSGSTLRLLTAVEIMMPLISREALRLGGYLFAHSVSGWGLDFALGDLVNRHYGPGRVAVIDEVGFTHAKAIDPTEGAYYRMLQDHGLSALVEERAMDLLYGAKGPIQEI